MSLNPNFGFYVDLKSNFSGPRPVGGPFGSKLRQAPPVTSLMIIIDDYPNHGFVKVEEGTRSGLQVFWGTNATYVLARIFDDSTAGNPFLGSSTKSPQNQECEVDF